MILFAEATTTPRGGREGIVIPSDYLRSHLQMCQAVGWILRFCPCWLQPQRRRPEFGLSKAFVLLANHRLAASAALGWHDLETGCICVGVRFYLSQGSIKDHQKAGRNDIHARHSGLLNSQAGIAPFNILRADQHDLIGWNIQRPRDLISNGHEHCRNLYWFMAGCLRRQGGSRECWSVGDVGRL